jgi:hypothetical protein
MRLLISVSNFGNGYTIFRIISGEKDILRGGELEPLEKIIYKGEHLFLSLENSLRETKRLCAVYEIPNEKVFVSSSGGMSVAFKEKWEALCA